MTWVPCETRDGPSQYARTNGEYTICKVGSADGWKYELWKGREQLAVNLESYEAALTEHSRRLASETSHGERGRQNAEPNALEMANSMNGGQSTDC